MVTKGMVVSGELHVSGCYLGSLKMQQYSNSNGKQINKSKRMADLLIICLPRSSFYDSNLPLLRFANNPTLSNNKAITHIQFLSRLVILNLPKTETKGNWSLLSKLKR